MTDKRYPLSSYLRPKGDLGTGYFCETYTRTVYTVSNAGKAKYTSGNRTSVSYISKIREPVQLESQLDPKSLVSEGVLRQKQWQAFVRPY